MAVLGVLGCASLPGRPVGDIERWGFTAPWDPRSAASVARHGAQLDVLVTGWITLDSVSLKPVCPFRDSVSRDSATRRRTMALVTSYQGTRFHPEIIRALAQDSITLGKTAGAIATLADSVGYGGLVLDFEGMAPDDVDTLIAVVKAVADSARHHGIAPIALAIPATDTAAYPARPLLSAADLLVVMLYDQHWLTSAPGPIAEPEWVQRQLGIRAGEVGPSKLVAAFPVYGYQWHRGAPTDVISYDDARQRAANAHVPLQRAMASMTLHAETSGAQAWSIWVSDAVLLDELMRGARARGVRRFAIWRLGLEDPAMWVGSGRGSTQ